MSNINSPSLATPTFRGTEIFASCLICWRLCTHWGKRSGGKEESQPSAILHTVDMLTFSWEVIGVHRPRGSYTDATLPANTRLVNLTFNASSKSPSIGSPGWPRLVLPKVRGFTSSSRVSSTVDHLYPTTPIVVPSAVTSSGGGSPDLVIAFTLIVPRANTSFKLSAAASLPTLVPWLLNISSI